MYYLLQRGRSESQGLKVTQPGTVQPITTLKYMTVQLMNNTMDTIQENEVSTEMSGELANLTKEQLVERLEKSQEEVYVARESILSLQAIMESDKQNILKIHATNEQLFDDIGEERKYSSIVEKQYKESIEKMRENIDDCIAERDAAKLAITQYQIEVNTLKIVLSEHERRKVVLQTNTSSWYEATYNDREEGLAQDLFMIEALIDHHSMYDSAFIDFYHDFSQNQFLFDEFGEVVKCIRPNLYLYCCDTCSAMMAEGCRERHQNECKSAMFEMPFDSAVIRIQIEKERNRKLGSIDEKAAIVTDSHKEAFKAAVEDCKDMLKNTPDKFKDLVKGIMDKMSNRTRLRLSMKERAAFKIHSDEIEESMKPADGDAPAPSPQGGFGGMASYLETMKNYVMKPFTKAKETLAQVDKAKRVAEFMKKHAPSAARGGMLVACAIKLWTSSEGDWLDIASFSYIMIEGICAVFGETIASSLKKLWDMDWSKQSSQPEGDAIVAGPVPHFSFGDAFKMPKRMVKSIGAIVATIMTLGGRVPLIMDVVKKVSDFARTIITLSKLPEIMSKVYEWFADLYYKHFSSDPRTTVERKLGKEYAGLSNYMAACDIIMLLSPTQILEDSDIACVIIEIWKIGVQLNLSRSDPLLANTINRYQARLLPRFEQARKSPALIDKTRPEPLAIWLYGSSQIGKSRITQAIAHSVYERLYYDDIRVAELKKTLKGAALDAEMIKLKAKIYNQWGLSNLYWQRRVENRFYDGWAHQLFIIYDDICQMKDSAAVPNPEIMEIINIVNSESLQLNMSTTEDKAGTYFNSPFIIASSNEERPTIESISHPEAFTNRFGMALKVIIKDEYRLKNGKLNSAKSQNVDFNDLWHFVEYDLSDKNINLIATYENVADVSDQIALRFKKLQKKKEDLGDKMKMLAGHPVSAKNAMSGSSKKIKELFALVKSQAGADEEEGEFPKNFADDTTMAPYRPVLIRSKEKRITAQKRNVLEKVTETCLHAMVQVREKVASKIEVLQEDRVKMNTILKTPKVMETDFDGNKIPISAPVDEEEAWDNVATKVHATHEKIMKHIKDKKTLRSPTVIEIENNSLKRKLGLGLVGALGIGASYIIYKKKFCCPFRHAGSSQELLKKTWCSCDICARIEAEMRSLQDDMKEDEYLSMVLDRAKVLASTDAQSLANIQVLIDNLQPQSGGYLPRGIHKPTIYGARSQLRAGAPLMNRVKKQMAEIIDNVDTDDEESLTAAIEDFNAIEVPPASVPVWQRFYNWLVHCLRRLKYGICAGAGTVAGAASNLWDKVKNIGGKKKTYEEDADVRKEIFEDTLNYAEFTDQLGRRIEIDKQAALKTANEKKLSLNAVTSMNKVISRNVVRLILENGNTVNGVFIKGRHCLTVMHLWEAREGDRIWVHDVWTEKRIPIPIDEVRCHQWHGIDGKPMDLCYLIFPRTISEKPDIRSLFLEESKRLPMLMNDVLMLSGITMVKEVPSINNTTTNKAQLLREVPCLDLLHQETIYYSMRTFPGQCGYLLYSMSTNTPQHIIGLHVAGDTESGHAFALTITRPQLDHEYQKSLISVESQMYEPVIPTTEVIVASNLPFEGIITPVGLLPKDAVAKGGKRTKLLPSLIHGKVYAPKTAPAVLTNVKRKVRSGKEELVSVMMPQVAKKAKDVKLVPQWTKKLAVDYVASEFDLQPGEEKITRKLTVAEAIMGVEGADYINAMPRGTSAGFSFNKHDLGKKKSYWLGKEQQFIIDNPDLLQKMEEIEQECREDRTPVIIWTGHAKDERISQEKIDLEKTRLFEAPPLAYAVLSRQYFQAFYAHMMDNKIINGCGPGMNPYSLDWTLLVKCLDRIGEHRIAGDFSQYSGSQKPEWMWMVYDVIDAWYKKYEDPDEYIKHENIRRRLWEAQTFPYLLIERNLLRCHGSGPDGDTGTVHRNNLVKKLLNCIAYLMLKKKNGIYPSLHDFADHVYDCDFGDDSMMAVSDDVVDWYNQHTLTETYGELGYTFTDENKGSDAPKSRNQYECTFLKRSFKPWFGTFWRAPLDIDVIREMLNWVRGPDIVDLTMQNVMNVEMELAIHGEEIYYFEMNEVVKALAEVGIDYKLRRWREWEHYFMYSAGLIAERTRIMSPSGNEGKCLTMYDTYGSLERPDFSDANILPQMMSAGDEWDATESTPNTITSEIESEQTRDEPEMSTTSTDPVESCDQKMHTLKDILARNIQLRTITLNGSSATVLRSYGKTKFELIKQHKDNAGLLVSIDVVTDILKANPVMWAKMQNSLYLKADAVIEIRLSCLPMAQGIIYATWMPYTGVVDDLHSYGNLTLQGLTSFPFEKLNYTSGKRLKVTCRFASFVSALNLTKGDTSFGKLVLWQPVKAWVGSKASNVSITIMGRLENIELSTPHHENNLSGVSMREVEFSRMLDVLAYPDNVKADFQDMFAKVEQQAEGEEDKPITQIVRKVDSMMDKIPLVKQIASVVSTGIELLKGASKPTNLLPIRPVTNIAGFRYCQLEGQDLSVSLSAVPNNTVSAVGAGLATQDPMHTHVILARPNIVHTFDWKASHPVGNLITSWMIHPLLYGQDYSVLGQQGSFGYCSSMFNYYRGGLTYEIDFVKTNFHGGRIVIVFLPQMLDAKKIPSTLGSLMSTNYHVIVDITQVPEGIVLDVPYVSNKGYQLMTFSDAEDSWSKYRATGVSGVAIYSLTDLQYSEVVSDTISFVVSMRRGRDFELALPGGHRQIGFFDGWHLDADEEEEVHPCYVNIQPQLLTPVSFIDCASPGLLITEGTMGESVESLRALIKRFTRYSFHETDANHLHYTWLNKYIYDRDRVNHGEFLSLFDQIKQLYLFRYGSMRVKVISEQAGTVRTDLILGQPNQVTGQRHLGVSHTINTNVTAISEIEVPHYYGYRKKVTGFDFGGEGFDGDKPWHPGVRITSRVFRPSEARVLYTSGATMEGSSVAYFKDGPAIISIADKDNQHWDDLQVVYLPPGKDDVYKNYVKIKMEYTNTDNPKWKDYVMKVRVPKFYGIDASACKKEITVAVWCEHLTATGEILVAGGDDYSCDVMVAPPPFRMIKEQSVYDM